MFIRSVVILATMICCGISAQASAGYYSTIDAPEELRWSRDYENVFLGVLNNLRAIPAQRVEHDPTMRRRYMLMEALARDGNLKLDTLEQKLNWSAVLIRRGKADQAMQLLAPLTKEQDKNFVVLSQYAMARFLMNNPDFTPEAPDFMKQALELWPQRWTDVDDEQRKFLESIGWEETAFERYRRYETYVERLMRNRVREDLKRKKKLPLEEAVDPIFLDANAKAIRFVNDQGAFAAGRIAPADQEQMPRDSVEVVEQLLIWMPNDQRLFWLLGEVFNASAMEHTDQKGKNLAIRSAFLIFDKMTHPLAPTNYGFKEIQSRRAVLETYLKNIPEEEFKLPDEPASPWWRIAGGFATGLVVGMFALWQIQELRRRRQGRTTAQG